MNSQINVKAYAKLNLFLDITGRLPNNYHALNTVMQSVSLADGLNIEVCEADKTEIIITTDNPSLPANEKNIAWRAAAMFLNNFKKTAYIKIDIKKHIPIEAGLGGSSTDGAATLAALNKLYGKPYTLNELASWGASLGADVPFCVLGGTRLCTWTGTDTEELPFVSDCVFVIIKPDFSYNTTEAYSFYDKNPPACNKDFENFLSVFKNNNFLNNADKMYNVFEKLYEKTPEYREIKMLKEILIENGAKSAVMTGSGSAVFGVFGSEKEAKKAYMSIDYPETSKFIALPVNADFIL